MGQEGRHCKKSRKNLGVIPAKAGHVGQWREIHSFQIVKKAWIPFFKGMTTFCSDIKKAEDRRCLQPSCPFRFKEGLDRYEVRLAA